MAQHNNLPVTIVGIIGNIITGLVYLAPLPTYYNIYKKKSTEEFQAVPYVVALFSAMLWLYYALLKKEEIYLLSINSVGCVIETLYIAFFCAYASRNTRISTTKLVLLTSAIFAVTVIIIQFILGADSKKQEKVLGIICAVVSIGVYAAPLTIVVKVIRTKSVEFMPFQLSFFLTLCAVIWFIYGWLRKDFFIFIPNVLGIILGLLQMVLYAVCKNCSFSNISKEHLGNTSNKNDFNLVTVDHQIDSEQQGDDKRTCNVVL